MGLFGSLFKKTEAAKPGSGNGSSGQAAGVKPAKTAKSMETPKPAESLKPAETAKSAEMPRPAQPPKTPAQLAWEKEMDQLNRWSESQSCSPARKFKLLQALAEEGYPAGIYDLGHMYGNGEYVEKDWDKARELFLQCYEEIPAAALWIGLMDLNFTNFHVKPENPIGEGIHFLCMAAGNGVEEAFPKVKEKMESFEEEGYGKIVEVFLEELDEILADLKGKDDEKAYDTLGLFYQYGLCVEQNLAKAKEYFEKSAAFDPEDDCSVGAMHLANPIFEMLEDEDD